VVLRYARRPRLDLLARNLDGVPALSAHKVMMVLSGAATSIDGLTLRRTEDVDLTRTGKRLEISVHGGQSDTLTLGLELVVQLLSGAEPVGGDESFLDCRPLLGRSRDRQRFSVHFTHLTTARARASTLDKTKATIAPITIVAPGGAST
jgi:hypothetical protein